MTARRQLIDSIRSVLRGGGYDELIADRLIADGIVTPDDLPTVRELLNRGYSITAPAGHPMTTPDTCAETSRQRADCLIATHRKLEAVAKERDELAAKVARVEALAESWSLDGKLRDSFAWTPRILDQAATRVRGALDGAS
jgi:hypothetical protein